MYEDNVLKLLPHRDPFIFCDKIISFDEDKKECTTSKIFHDNDFFFIGHFPSNPIVPGVILIETRAQCAIILIKNILKDLGGLYYLSGVEDSKFFQILKPNIEITIKSTLVRQKAGFYVSECQIHDVSTNVIICSATIKAFCDKKAQI